MPRKKLETDAECGLAVGLVMSCAIDVKASNDGEQIQQVAGLEKLLTAVEHLSQLFGWSDEPRTVDGPRTERANTRH